jgi:hypothetical protein
MNTRTERVVLETDRHLIVGDLNLPREGYRSRFSDFLNQGNLSFLPLVDAEVRPLNGEGAPQHREFLAVARTHVKLAYPHEDTQA